MKHPSRGAMTGPLTPFAAAFVEELGRRGYARDWAVAQMQLVAHLSRWMAAEGLAAGELTAAQVQRFAEARRAAGYRHFVRPSALAPLLECLRGLGVAPAADAGVLGARADLLAERYREYLVDERALAVTTVRAYVGVARRFLDAVGEPDLAGLTAGAVGRFVLAEVGRVGPGSAGNVVVGLRSLLRFLHVEGLIAGELSAAVPAVAPRPRGLPRALPAQTVARCWPAAIGGRRRGGAISRC